MAFDILFMIQHFILYRNNSHAPVANSDIDGDDNRPPRQYVNFNNDDESHYRNSGTAYNA